MTQLRTEANRINLSRKAEYHKAAAVEQELHEKVTELIPKKKDSNDSILNTVTRLILFLKHQSVVNVVKINSINYDPTGASEETFMTRLKVVPYTKTVKRVSLEISGEYQDYRLLKSFIQQMEEFPLAITQMKIRENNWNIHFDVYGETPNVQ